MDIIAFNEASTANGRIESFIENPDSSSGIVTVPKTIASGETITIPAGRVAILPNVQVDGVINIEGEVFVPSGSTYGNRVMYEKINYIATQGQTVFSVNYDLGSVDVYVNGIRLANTDFTATTLTSVTLASGLNAGDIVELVSFGAFTVADTYTKAETDNALSFKANTTDLKEIGVGQTVQNVVGSRGYNQIYTNSTGKPIFVMLGITTLAGTAASLQIETSPSSGIYEVVAGDASSANITTNLVGIVPNLCRYKVVTVNTPNLNLWKELR